VFVSPAPSYPEGSALAPCGYQPICGAGTQYTRFEALGSAIDPGYYNHRWHVGSSRCRPTLGSSMRRFTNPPVVTTRYLRGGKERHPGHDNPELLPRRGFSMKVAKKWRKPKSKSTPASD
jgi:hypothetical protein